MRLGAPSRATLVRGGRATGSYLAASLVVAVVALPLVVETAVTNVSFEDALGTLPVEMSLCHDGRSTLETGVLGDLYWDRTGSFGFGIRARVTEPPQAGGTLASYVDKRFLKANLEFVKEPDEAIARYTEEFRSRLVHRVVAGSAVVGLVGGVLVVVALRRRGSDDPSRHPLLVPALVAVGALLASGAAALVLLDRWSCNDHAEAGLPFPGVPQLSFSSPQTLEVARQVRPFIEKNTERIEERTAEFTDAASSSFAEALRRRTEALRPRRGEVLVIAEADPQGSYVGAAVRTSLEAQLVESLGDAVAFRTISGDITSNGTVAEDAYVQTEAEVGGDLPTLAVGGDHDSETTQSQMEDHGMVVPDLETTESDDTAGLAVTGANDVEHKALFGALVTNDSGLTEQELGAELRESVPDDGAGIVLVHQPDAAAGYLGLDDLDPVRALDGSLTEPYDDGIPDVPGGTINIGHLHDLDGPWVLWNTDGDEVTWTVVDQLGTSGGAEEHPTFNRFSTPFSIPLKELSMRLQFFERTSGLQTGFATIRCDVTGQCRISPRTDVGLPIEPAPR